MRKITWILFLFLMACVDPLGVKLIIAERRLVVDGAITNLPGPYQVKLFYSNKLSATTLSPFEAVTLAQVSVFDDLNNKYNLTEVSPGIYETNANELTGEIGRSYYLTIKTQLGAEYQSSIQEMTEPGAINDLYFEFEKESVSDNGKLADGLKVYIDSKGVPDGDNLFRWRWTTIHKTTSNAELQTRSTPGGEIPDPELCSGYVYQRRQLIRIGDCTCCVCWSYNYSDAANVSTGNFVSDNQFNKQYLGLIPVTSMHFFERYYIEVQQLSLSEEAYNFWNLIGKQQKGATDLFQPNAIKVRGNMRNINNPDDEVLGFFGVSGAASKSLYIQETVVPYPLPALDSVNYSCLAYFKNATTEKPPFW
jgi:Domain of unknown function (DUF4249)